MSTSRSIASAINRRAGNNAPKPNQPQPAFNPKISQSQGQQIPKNVRFVPSGQGANPIPQQQPQQPQQQKRPPYQEPTIPVKTAGVNGPVGQVSISDAFALVTIRLGRVEQYIQQIQEEGVPFSSNIDTTSSTQIPDNQMVVDLQNTQKLLQTQQSFLQSQQEMIQTLTQKVNEYDNTFSRYNNELRDLKDMLLTLSMKSEKSILDYTNALSKMESNLSITNEKTDSLKTKLDSHSTLQVELQNKLELHIESQNKIQHESLLKIESDTQTQPENSLQLDTQTQIENQVQLNTQTDESNNDLNVEKSEDFKSTVEDA